MAHAIFFYIFSAIAIISAIMVTASKNTVHSVFFLILDFISISCLFIMIGAEFLGMIMLIVYVGAVAVLFLFVVMMLNVAQQKNQWFLSEETSSHIPVGLIISTIIFFELIIVIGGWKYKPDLFNSENLSIKNEISNKVFGFGGHINISKFNYNQSYENDPIFLNPDIFSKIESLDFVSSIHPFATKAGIIKESDEILNYLFEHPAR